VLINFTIVTSSNGTSLNLSLIDFIELVRKRIEIKVLKFFVLKLPDYESYILLPRFNCQMKMCNSLESGCSLYFEVVKALSCLIFISECRLLHYSEGRTHCRLRICHWWTVLLLWWIGQNRGELLSIRQTKI